MKFDDLMGWEDDEEATMWIKIHDLFGLVIFIALVIGLLGYYIFF